MSAMFFFSGQQLLDGNGNPVAGAKMWSYAAGTTTPLTTYSDAALTTANTNPVVTDADGRFPAIFLQAQDYKFAFLDASDTPFGTTLDNYATDNGTASQTQTLTNKTIALGSNTLSGTTAQFNAAVTDGDFATQAALDAIATGIEAFGTETALLANLAYDDKTLAWAADTGSFYAKSGASGSGSWVVNTTSPTTVVQAAVEKDFILNQGIGYSTELDRTTIILNGAQYWDGTTTTGATNTSGGWKIPAGSTGASTYINIDWQITAAQSALMAGRSARLVAMCDTSDDLIAELTVSSIVRLSAGTVTVTGTAGTVSNKAYRQIDTNTIAVEFDYEFTGDETNIRLFFQVTSNDACAADATCFVRNTFWKPLDDRGTGDVIASELAPYALNSGSLAPITRPRFVQSNGLRAYRDKTGVIIPTGSTGASSQATFEVPLFNVPVGTRVKATYTFTTSADIDTETGTLTRTAFVRNNDGSTITTGITSTITKDSSTQITGTAEYTTTASHRGIEFYVLFPSGAGTRTSDGTLVLADAVLEIISVPTDATITTVTAEYRRAAAVRLGTLEIFKSLGVVGPVSSGEVDYTSIRSAVEALGAGETMDYRTASLVNPGWYTGEVSTSTDIDPDGFLVIEGRGAQPERVVLDARFPAATADQDDIEGVFFKRPGIVMRNMMVLAENIRYPLHIESGDSNDRATIIFEDCVIVHYGADGWASPTAAGIGQHDDATLIFRRCKMVSYDGAAVGFHDNKDFVRGCRIIVEDCEMVTLGDATASISCSNQGSGVVNQAIFIGSDVGPHLNINAGSWLSSQLNNQPANRNNYRLYFRGCTPFDWVSDSRVDCLELHSAAGASSAMTFTESAASRLLFGNGYEVVRGGAGLSAKVRSEFAITVGSGETDPGVTLAARLGDMTASAETFTMQFDGGADVSIDLDANYSAMTNQQVVDNLNTKLQTALGGSLGGKGFEVVRPYDNRAPVFDEPRQATRKNADTTAILKGHALAFSGRHVRIMTSADASSLFAGIALEDAPAGDPVRFQKAGQINENHLLPSGLSGIVIGDTLQVSSTDGELEEGSTTPLLRCISTNTYGDTFEFIGREH